MQPKIPLLLAALTFVVAPLAMGQTYIGSVLYQIMTPSGFTDHHLGVIDGSGAVYSNQTVGYGYQGDGNSIVGDHALLWTASGAVDLNPTTLTGFPYSQANGTCGTQQVGTIYQSNYNARTGVLYVGNAALWTGTAASVVDLNPGILGTDAGSSANGTSGTQQVGVGAGSATGGNNHAMLWNGTAASAVDLNPSALGVFWSDAFATNGDQQVGTGFYSLPTNDNSHAFLWNGTAASAVDLTPTLLSGITNSVALGTSGTQQVGYGSNDGSTTANQALLWTGTADSAVDLNSASFGISSAEAFATNGVNQVGFGYGNETGGFYDHALLWSGTADSVVDLHNVLPTSLVTSEATSIDSSGNVYGFAIGTFNNLHGEFAVEWSPVPEPTTVSLLMIAGSGIFLRRGRKQSP